MFTGIIQSTGAVIKRAGIGSNITFTVKPAQRSFLSDAKTGDSISVNGACMTIEKKSGSGFQFSAVRESLKKANLGLLTVRSIVNLEKAMRLGERIDGHLVQGHVDTTGTVFKVTELRENREVYISLPEKFLSNVIYVGSVSLNGVSMTVAEIKRAAGRKFLIKVTIVPHTLKNTNLGSLNKGDVLNVEFDMLGKYVMNAVKESRDKKTHRLD